MGRVRKSFSRYCVTTSAADNEESVAYKSHFPSIACTSSRASSLKGIETDALTRSRVMDNKKYGRQEPAISSIFLGLYTARFCAIVYI